MEYIARTPEQLGQVLKSCRQLRGLTQSAVGSKVGTKQSTISEIETHSASASVDTLYKILSALGLALVLRDQTAPVGRKKEW
jgi:HTH-type transcriptional regulator / antitoxin HipB